ncbi:MAG TPA: oligosaccharide flippase family protein [Candidatus Aquilonibacter sp.]|nr:oligosaccharide flippase family protein [Candidatus Aquilonibacter sp.]
MRRIEAAQIIKNVGSSWFSLGINIVVGILLSPFILHRLGDTAFGIWVLIFSITGYYGLFDLGVRSSIIRYVSRFTAMHDTEATAKLINTSLFAYSCIGVLSFLITIVGALHFDSLFHVSPELQSSTRWLFLIVGTSVSLGFPLGIPGGILQGLQRFYILNWTNVATALLRAALVVFFLDRGYGLLTVGMITVILPLLASVVRGVIVLHLLPVPFGWRYINRETFREIANYSGITLIVILASQLRFQTDEIIIGTFLSAAAITYFNIGARIVDYAIQTVLSLAQIFAPMSSESDAVGDQDRLRKIFLAGNRFCAFIMFPICAILIILGKSVIEVWVGAKYVSQSYPVLLVILIPSTLFFAQASSGRILFGVGKHRTWAIVSVIEGFSNLILSILLVRPYGIVGDAWGTAIPLTCSAVLFFPAHLCRLLGVRMKTFLREAFELPLLLCVPLVAALLGIKRIFIAHNYWQLGIQLAVGGAVYSLGLLWAFKTNRALRVRSLFPGEPAFAQAAAEAVPVQSFPGDE